MEFNITEGVLKSIEVSDCSITVPDGVHTIGAGSLYFRHPPRVDHITLPESIQVFEDGEYCSGLDMNTGIKLTMPASVYQRIDEDVLYNGNCPNPSRNYEFRADVIKPDGTHIELYVVYVNEYEYHIDNFWEISDIEALTEEDFYRYDEKIDKPPVVDGYGRKKALTASQKVRVRLSRLLHPYMLDDTHHSQFIKYICSHAKEAFEYVLEHDDRQMLQLLIDIKAVSGNNNAELFPLIEKADTPRCRSLWDSTSFLTDAPQKIKAKEDAQDKRIQTEIMNNGYKSDSFDSKRKLESEKYRVKPAFEKKYQYTVSGGSEPYTVMAFDGYYMCSCPDFQRDPKNCKHIIAVRSYLKDPALSEKASAGVASRLPRNASTDEKLNDLVAQLREKYKGKNIYSRYDIEADNPKLNWDTFNTWAKKAAGMTAGEYLIAKGIMKPYQWFNTRPDNVLAEDLSGKKVCTLDDQGNSIPEIETLLKKYGAVIVTPESNEIDYLCLMIQSGVLKEPVDRNKTAYSLLRKREDGKLSFSIFGKDLLIQLYTIEEQTHIKTLEEREALGIHVFNTYPFSDDIPSAQDKDSFSVISNISTNSLPRIDDSAVYWTLREFRDWFEASGGSVRYSSTNKYSDGNIDQSGTLNKVRQELEVFKRVCSSISSPAVKQYIIDHAVKKLDGTLHKGRVQIVAPFKYTSSTTSYYALIARNKNAHEIIVSCEERSLPYIDDMDYEWDHKLDACIDGIDPLLLSRVKSILHPTEYAYRNKPGYIYIDSDSGKIPDNAFANDDSIQYVEMADWIHEIGKRAFANCQNLKDVAIPSTVESIAEDAFIGCPVTVESEPEKTGYEESREEEKQSIYEEEWKEHAAQWMSKFGKYVEERPQIDFDGKNFVFSGLDWRMGENKKDHPVVQKVIEKGGQFRSEVSGRTDYFIVDPRHTGNKVLSVVDQKNKGKTIRVILLDDLLKILNGAEAKAEAEAKVKAEAEAKAKAEAEAKVKDEAEAKAWKAAEEEKKRAVEERKHAEEVERKRVEEERKRAEEDRKRAEKAVRIRAEEERKRAEEERKRLEEENRIKKVAAFLQQKLTAAYQDQLSFNQFEALKNTLSSEITGICDKPTWVEIQKRGLQATPFVHLEETNKRISAADSAEEAYKMLPEWIASEYIGIAEEKRSRQKYVDTLNALAQLSKEPVLPDFERNLGKVEYENGITSKAIAIIGDEALFDSLLKKYINFRELEALRLILELKEGDSAKTIIDALRSKKAAEYQRLEALLEKRSNDLEAIRQEEIHLKEERSHLGFFQGKRKKEIAALLEKIPERIKQVEDEYETAKSKI